MIPSESINIKYDNPDGESPVICSVFTLEEANEKILSLQQTGLVVLDVEMVAIKN